jgi:hypothetical protein
VDVVNFDFDLPGCGATVRYVNSSVSFFISLQDGEKLAFWEQDGLGSN